MCETRYWNRLIIEPILKEEDKILIPLVAERSDYETFRVVIVLNTKDIIIDIAAKIKKAYETLEGYRNCDCTVKGGICIKHLDSIKTSTPNNLAKVFTFK